MESLVQEKEAIAEKLKEENRKALEQLRERLQDEAEQSKKVGRKMNFYTRQINDILNGLHWVYEEFQKASSCQVFCLPAPMFISKLPEIARLIFIHTQK